MTSTHPVMRRILKDFQQAIFCHLNASNFFQLKNTVEVALYKIWFSCNASLDMPFVLFDGLQNSAPLKCFVDYCFLLVTGLVCSGFGLMTLSVVTDQSRFIKDSLQAFNSLGDLSDSVHDSSGQFLVKFDGDIDFHFFPSYLPGCKLWITSYYQQYPNKSRR
ncbi:MAG: hypothetical protein U5K27_07550 [Desulfotignum sp.]|nr:hypothetical protein [Desulfotignum sp.]